MSNTENALDRNWFLNAISDFGQCPVLTPMFCLWISYEFSCIFMPGKYIFPTSFFLIFSSSSLTVGRGTKIYLKMHNGLLIKTTVQQLKGLIRLVFTKQCQGKILVTTLAKSSRAASPCSGSASAADSTFSFTPTSGDNLIKLSTCCGPPTNVEMQGRSDSSSVSASLPLAGQVPATSPHSV